MHCSVEEIASGVFRLSTFHPGFGIQFNQFLVLDDEPLLFHSGFRSLFETTRQGVAQVMDPARLRWLGFSHFEADECGALNQWLACAPAALPACGSVGAMVNLSDYAERPARALADGETLVTGSHQLVWLATPHVPHGWDAGLLFDRTSATLFCSDLLFQPGDPGPVGGAELVQVAREAIAAGRNGPLANDVPYTARTRPTLERLAALQPTTLAAMHGAALCGDGSSALLALADSYDELLGGHAGQVTVAS